MMVEEEVLKYSEVLRPLLKEVPICRNSFGDLPTNVYWIYKTQTLTLDSEFVILAL